MYHYEKNSQVFFNIMTELLLGQKQTNTSAESLGSQLFGARSTKAWHGQEGATPTCRKRHRKNSRFNGVKSGRIFFFHLIFNVLML